MGPALQVHTPQKTTRRPVRGEALGLEEYARLADALAEEE